MFKLNKINKKDVVKEYLENRIKYNELPEETQKLFLDIYYFGFTDGLYYAQDYVERLFDTLQETIPKW